MKQTFGSKVAIITIPILLLLTVIFLIGSSVSNNTSNEQKDNETSTEVVTPEEENTPAPTEEELPPRPTNDGASAVLTPYSTEQSYAALTLGGLAALEQCKKTTEENDNQRIERLSKYLPNAQEIVEVENLLGLTGGGYMSTRCNVLNSIIEGYNPETGIIDVHVPTKLYYITSDQKDINPDDRIILTKFQPYKYKMQLQSDNTWKIIEAG